MAATIIKDGWVLSSNKVGAIISLILTSLRKERDISQDVHGDLTGLKSSQVKALEKLFKRRMRADAAVTVELATQLTFVSQELNRVVAVLVDRNGRVRDVMLGDTDRVYLPDLGRQRAGGGRFRGVRLIRTHLKAHNEQVALSRDDLADLSKLKLDLVMTIAVGPGGYPDTVSWAHLVPPNPDKRLWAIQNAAHPTEIHLDFRNFIVELEAEFQRKSTAVVETSGTPAMLVYVSTPSDRGEEVEIGEMLELCRTAGVEIVDTFIQRRSNLHPRYAIGKGKLEDLTLRALQMDVDLVIFAQDLNPGQMRALTDITDLKVIDRTQLILDIFAQHATTRDGKLQVELAQLRYNLPRLGTKNTGMSRLTGGIGGRGPGETKLEINRRRAHDRIRRLEKDIERLGQQRQLRRQRRQRNGVPVVAIVGYTNAGKSTLLNGLTASKVLSEDKLFATLRPTSRQLQSAAQRDIIFTDTVGFIHDLPQDLVAAFKATLEELEEADVLVHLVDISNDDFESRIDAVNTILDDLGLSHKDHILAFNKADLVEERFAASIAHRYGGVSLSALNRDSARDLLEEVEQRLFALSRSERGEHVLGSARPS